MVDVTLIRPLNKGQCHSFLVPIDFSYTTSYRLSIATYALGRTVWPQYITSQTTNATLLYKRNRTQCGRPKIL